MGGSLLGALAGGYAQAAEQERRRQFEAESQQRQNALGLSKILLENPAVPPEYKGLITQYAMDVMHAKPGSKIPDFHKSVVMQTPQIGTVAKTESYQQPQFQIGAPAIPPSPPNPQGLGTGQPQQGPPSLTQGGTAAAGGAFPSIGPAGTLPPVAPPPVPQGVASPGMTIPARTATVTQAQSPNFVPAGQFHMMSPQEMAQRDAEARMAQAQSISDRTGLPLAQVLGIKPDVREVGPGAKLINVTPGGEGAVIAEGGPRPFQGPRYRPEEVAGFPTGNVIDEQTHRTIPESEWSKDPEAKIAGEGAKAALKAKVDERLRQEQASFTKSMAVAQQSFINALQKQSATEAKSALDSTRTAWQKINADVGLDKQRMDEMSKSLEKAKQGDQQAMFALTANHILMTAGQKGGRATQAMYNMAEQSAPWLQRVQARFDKDGYLSGVVLTPDQAQSMFDLAKDRMAIRGQTADAAHQAYTDASKEYKTFLGDMSKGKVKTPKPLAQPSAVQPGVTHVWDPTKGLQSVGGNE